MAKYTEAQRISFNSGHHDGAALGANHSLRMWETGKHFDRFYEAGFWSGVRAKDSGTYNEKSDNAWTEFVAYEAYNESVRIFPKKTRRKSTRRQGTR